HRVHDHAGGIGGLAAGDVDADALERPHPDAEGAAAFFAHLPAGGDALAVEVAHAHGGLADRRAGGRVDRLGGRLVLRAGDLELLDPGAVVLAHAGDQLAVAALADPLGDLADGL